MRKPKLVCETPLYRVMLVHDASFSIPSKTVNAPEDAAKIVADYLRGVDREHFVGLYLNSANGLITIQRIHSMRLALTLTICLKNSCLILGFLTRTSKSTRRN